MPRNKPTPKRRRLEEEEKEKQALATLKETPSELVEQAAADAFTTAVQVWPAVSSSTIPDWLNGLGVATTVPTNHFSALQLLHQNIQQQANGHWSSWSGDPQDTRRRAFGILPDTLGSNPLLREQLDISTPWKADSSLENERVQNKQATVILDTIPAGVQEAIEWLCTTMFPQIIDPSVRPYLSYPNLIAAQPNLHNGRQLLPIHVDHPLKDGFGIVIVTIAMVGDAQVLFQDYTDQYKAKMELTQGQCYMITGTARDACAHGVLAKEDSKNRESLNLRFGLHNWVAEGGELAMIPSQNVLKYWQVTEEGEVDAKAGAGIVKPGKTASPSKGGIQ